MTVFLADPPAADVPGRFSTGQPAPGMLGMALRLCDDGFGVVSWSQFQPLGSMDVAVAELGRLMDRMTGLAAHRPVFLVGHSRGGLIGRIYLAGTKKIEQVRGLVSICSPHRGTHLAEFSRYLNPAGTVLRRILPEKIDGRIGQALGRMAEFLSSPAIAELQPASPVIKRLDDEDCPVVTLSIGGTSPSLFSLYVRLREENGWHVYGLPELLQRILPDDRLPPELVAGRGDGLVTAASSILRGGAHENFSVNHIRAAFDMQVYRRIRAFLHTASG